MKKNYLFTAFVLLFINTKSSAQCTITLTSGFGTDNQTVCINSPIIPIIYTTGGTATGASVVGLPSGVTASYSGNTFTISGTPTVSGTFNYVVNVTGPGCGPTMSGSITVLTNFIYLTSGAGTNVQTVTVNTPITTITYGTVTATGANFNGLPPGVTGNWKTDVATISGIPSATGVYNYTVTLTGGCGGSPVTANGSITVNFPLPVTLVSFNGKLNSDKTVTLQWKVEDQQDILQYIVEESSDASVFNQSGAVTAGNSSSQNYSFIDRQVATGKNYYRLKIVELSGKITYSKIILVNLKAGIIVTLYPNPVTNKLTIQQFGTILCKTAVLYDGLGKIVQQIKLNNLEQTVTMETYSAGVYFMKLEDGTVYKIVNQ
jgi:hypothetical protein